MIDATGLRPSDVKSSWEILMADQRAKNVFAKHASHSPMWNASLVRISRIVTYPISKSSSATEAESTVGLIAW